MFLIIWCIGFLIFPVGAYIWGRFQWDAKQSKELAIGIAIAWAVFGTFPSLMLGSIIELWQYVLELGK